MRQRENKEIVESDLQNKGLKTTFNIFIHCFGLCLNWRFSGKLGECIVREDF